MVHVSEPSGRLTLPLPRHVTSAGVSGLVDWLIRSALLVIQPIWLLVTAVTVGPGWPSPGAIALLAATVGWLILLGSRRLGIGATAARSIDVGIVLMASLALAVLADRPADQAVAASLLVVGMVVTGLALPMLPAGVLSVLAAIVVGAALWRVAPRLASEAIVYGVAGGLGSLVARASLYRQAGRVEASTLDTEEVLLRQRTLEGVHSSVVQHERLLHETVLNTLTAISRGGMPASSAVRQTLVDRCREAQEVLVSLGAGASAPEGQTTAASLSAELDADLVRLRAEGIDVRVALDSLDVVPPTVRDAIGGAIREAVNNAVRHGQPNHIEINVGVQSESGMDVWAEVRDDGRGFDPRAQIRRYGTAAVIEEGMRQVGGSSSVRSAPGQGTTVLLGWHRRPPDAIDRFQRALGVLPLSPASLVSVFLLLTSMLGWLQFGHPLPMPQGIALAAVIAVLLALVASEAPVPWGFVLVAAALGPVFDLLAVSGESSSVLVGGWGRGVVAAFLVVLAAIGPKRGWLVLLPALLVLSADPLSGLLTVGTLALLGAAGLGALLRRVGARLDAEQRSRQRAESTMQAARESVERTRRQYAPLSESGAVDLLDGIANGRLDPADPQIRARAAEEEAFIRNLMRVHPDDDAVQDLTQRLARRAHARHVRLRVDLPWGTPSSASVPTAVEDALVAAISLAVPGSEARLAVRPRGAGAAISLVWEVLAEDQAVAAALPVPGVRADPSDPSDGTMILEAVISAEAATLAGEG
ncbi:MAG: hypothetical protein GC156_09730 [Actinomycetales bacterium]|nr:hypothetical protein [Actinomycetales bacterium]